MHGTLWMSIDIGYVFFFVFKASNVSWKLETEKTGTVNYIVESTLSPRK